MTNWTNPQTWATGNTVPASELNTYVRDNSLYLYETVSGVTVSAVQVSRAATQSIATSNDENITFDTQNFDYGGWYAAHGTQIIVPSGAVPTGYTTIGIDVYILARFATNSTGKRRIELLKNGASYETFKLVALDDDATTISFPAFTTVAAGDILKMNVWQNSGGALNVTLARMTVVRRGPAE